MLFLSSIDHLISFWLCLTVLASAQRDCEKDGDTSTYNQLSLVVLFENLCGKDIEASLNYSQPQSQDARIASIAASDKRPCAMASTTHRTPVTLNTTVI